MVLYISSRFYLSEIRMKQRGIVSLNKKKKNSITLEFYSRINFCTLHF